MDVAPKEENAAPLLVFEGFDPHTKSLKPIKPEEKVNKAPSQFEKL